jgi:hypothetical protein
MGGWHVTVFPNRAGVIEYSAWSPTARYVVVGALSGAALRSLVRLAARAAAVAAAELQAQATFAGQLAAQGVVAGGG